jgi:hypothetical protein
LTSFYNYAIIDLEDSSLKICCFSTQGSFRPMGTAVFTELKQRSKKMRKSNWISVGLGSVALACILMFAASRGCGSSETTITTVSTPHDRYPAPTPRAPKPFGLIRKALDRQADAAKTAKATSGTYKAATGDAAKEAIDGQEGKEALENQASYEEAQLLAAKREIQAKQDELVKTEREAKELPHKIAYQQDKIRSAETNLSRLESQLASMKNADARETRLRTIDGAKVRLDEMQTELGNLREKLDKATSHVDELKQFLSDPQDVTRRWNNGKGKIVIEE